MRNLLLRSLRELLPLLAAFCIRLLIRTLRHRRHGPLMRGPGIIAFYHGEQLLLLPHRPQHTPTKAIVSLSRDGDLQQAILQRLSIQSIRGSGSRGGLSALRAALRSLEAGELILIAVDGSRGPHHTIYHGALYLTLRSGAPIWAARARASRSCQLSSWDQFMIPRPFAELESFNSEPIFLSQEESLDSAKERLEQALRSLPPH